MLEQQIEQDIKTALLAGDKQRALTLRGLKSAMLNVKVANGTRDTAMADADVIQILSKESKKRQESAELYVQGGAQEKADAELSEKALIDTYLPKKLSEVEVAAIVDEVIASGVSGMGPIIGQVKQQTAGAADGGMIARLVKEKL